MIVNWAELPIVDLSKAATPEGRAELVPVVREAMHTYGFMYVINHGLSPMQVSLVLQHYSFSTDTIADTTNGSISPPEE